ncbi:MAG: hypothetical protein HC900_00045 [Methylacidiphilales bacterium]|nr:hypothetical protein [Candidatus Methylacidiphilales bacterium]
MTLPANPIAECGAVYQDAPGLTVRVRPFSAGGFVFDGISGGADTNALTLPASSTRYVAVRMSDGAVLALTSANADGHVTLARVVTSSDAISRIEQYPPVPRPVDADSPGSKTGATVSALDVAGVVHKTVLTLAETPVAVTDAQAYGSTKLYDFPEGRIIVLGVTASIQWAVTSDRAATINVNADMDWSLGTAAASATALASTMVNLLPKQDKQLSAAGGALNTASNAALAASAQFDGTSTAIDAYLNASFPTGTDIDGDGALTATGTVTIHWINLGDY